MAWLGNLNTWFQQPQQGGYAPQEAPQPGQGGWNQGGWNQGQAPSDPWGQGAFGGSFGASGAYQAGGGQGGAQFTPTVNFNGGEIAKEVRTLDSNRVKKAWKLLKDENTTMVNVWKSLAAVKKNVDPNLQRLRSDFEANIQGALAASQGNSNQAVMMLNQMVQTSEQRSAQGQEELWSQAVDTAARDVLKAERQSKHCTNLARMLQARSPGDPPAGAKQKELETLLKGCSLHTPALEGRIREAMGMEKTEKEKKKAADAAQNALIAQIVSATGVSKDRAKRTLENTGGDADNALVIIMSEKEAAKLKLEEQKIEKQERAARKEEKKRSGKAEECRKLAVTMGSMASATQRMAWAQVQLEFEAQLSVWQTQALIRAGAGGGSWSYEEAQREMEGVLATATREPTGAAILLEHALQNLMDAGYNPCNGLLVAADGILDADQIGQNRRRLAAKLGDIAKALEVGLPVKCDASQAREISNLVASCQIKDVTLANNAQKMLATEAGSVSL